MTPMKPGRFAISVITARLKVRVRTISASLTLVICVMLKAPGRVRFPDCTAALVPKWNGPTV